MKTFKELIGKTITNAEELLCDGYDDRAWLKLEFSDGSNVIIESIFGSYTGNSLGEYPCFIRINDEAYVENDYGDKKVLSE